MSIIEYCFFSSHINELKENNSLVYNTLISKKILEWTRRILDWTLTYTLMSRLLKKELKMICIYMCFGFFYILLQLINGNWTVTYFTLLQWLTESLTFHYSLLLSVCIYPTGLRAFCQIYIWLYSMLLPGKLPLFIIMRYIDNNPDFFMNRKFGWKWHLNKDCHLVLY